MSAYSTIKKIIGAIDFGHEWECVVKGSEIEDVKQDRQNTVMIEGYDF